MISERTKCFILFWLPVMKELEGLGVNPVRYFRTHPKDRTIEDIEKHYIAAGHCKEKYPEWWSVASEYVGTMMQ